MSKSTTTSSQYAHMNKMHATHGMAAQRATPSPSHRIMVVHHHLIESCNDMMHDMQNSTINVIIDDRAHPTNAKQLTDN